MRWMRRIALIVFVLLVALPVLALLLFRFLAVPATPQMNLSWAEGKGAHHDWEGWDDISPYLSRAVIESEDQNFCSIAASTGARSTRRCAPMTRRKASWREARSASRLARSLFLPPSRSWIRKGVEAWLTVLMETFWPKQRILTVYLNIVDWGHGKFRRRGRVARLFSQIRRLADGLPGRRLAAILPDPDDWRAQHPGPYVKHRSTTLVSRMAEVRRDNLESCLRR